MRRVATTCPSAADANHERLSYNASAIKRVLAVAATGALPSNGRRGYYYYCLTNAKNTRLANRLEVRSCTREIRLHKLSIDENLRLQRNTWHDMSWQDKRRRFDKHCATSFLIFTHHSVIRLWCTFSTKHSGGWWWTILTDIKFRNSTVPLKTAVQRLAFLQPNHRLAPGTVTTCSYDSCSRVLLRCFVTSLLQNQQHESVYRSLCNWCFLFYPGGDKLVTCGGPREFHRISNRLRLLSLPLARHGSRHSRLCVLSTIASIRQQTVRVLAFFKNWTCV